MTRVEWIRYWSSQVYALRFDLRCASVMRQTAERESRRAALERKIVMVEGALAACEEGTYQPPMDYRGTFRTFEP